MYKKLSILLFVFLVISFSVCGFADIQRVGSLQRVRAIPPRSEWSRFKILVWQFQTSILRDFGLYRKLGLGGFHIDRGAGQDNLVELSRKERFPYYVDHAADKGFLYLKDNDVNAVTGKRSLATRPHSLADPRIIEQIKEHLSRNISTTKKGLVLAYAYDDEISLGSFVTPCDVDKHPLSLAWFREWLRYEYKQIGLLNKEWKSDFRSFDEVMPKSFEEVRGKNKKPPLANWNLAPWMDFRHFMDFQFASVLSELTRYANNLDPKTPAGFVGGQHAGPYGGYDYAMLVRAVQWMEAYDVCGTNEILRSFWNQDRRPRMQTFASTKNPKLDSWFLWYYMLHGNQAVIAWPDGWFRTGGQDIAAYVLKLQDTFRETQGEVSATIVNSATKFDPDPIGIYYSHASIQAGWAMDVVTHGGSWINRKGSIDGENQTAGMLLKAWCKLLEDLGLQYDFISYLDVQEGAVDLSKRFKVIIMPRTICLSDIETRALKRFVAQGGTVVADYLCGVLDEHGKGRPGGSLDDIFGVVRDESAGYMNGKGLTEIDGEEYEQPLLKRFKNYDGGYRYGSLTVFERGTKNKSYSKGVEIKDDFIGFFHRCSVIVRNRFGKGQTVYLNLSPVQYWAPEKRFSRYGQQWRCLISKILEQSGIQARVTVYENNNPENMIECLYWKNGNKHYLGLVKNPTEHNELATVGQGRIQGITGKETDIQLKFKAPLRDLINLRTSKHLGSGMLFADRLKPWEGDLYEIVY